MEKKLFGNLPCGCEVYSYKLTNGKMSATILNLGGIIQKLVVDGVDVVMGFDTVEDILTDTSYQGSLIGRYGNRIAGAFFEIDGKRYDLAVNDNGCNCLHGGKRGFNRKIWTVESYEDTKIVLSYLSVDGEENFPGNLNVTVTYTLTENGLAIHYEAVSDKDTYVNLTNHAYFNLNGVGNGDILSHKLKINADTYTTVDSVLIPTGRADVAGTAYDFTVAKEVGRDLTGKKNTDDLYGYDHNFNLTGREKEMYLGRELSVAAVLSGDKLTMTALTDQPAVQLYTAGFLGGPLKFKNNTPITPRMALCLETQFENDAPSRGENLLPAGKKYDTMTVYKFDI